MQRGSNSSIVVRVVVAALVVGAGYLVYELGRIQAGYNLVDAGEERAAFEATIAGLENEIQGLNEEIALLETHRDIEQAAYADVEASLNELQTRIQEQQEAIAFYRGIVAPADGNAGLRVQDFRLTRGAEEREYTIRLVLIQARRHNRRVSGEVELVVEGTENGEQKSYSYADLVPEEADETWAFSFRYFQDFDRPVVLPDGFTPERVSVHVESRTRAIDSIDENFGWLASVG